MIYKLKDTAVSNQVTSFLNNLFNAVEPYINQFDSIWKDLEIYSEFGWVIYDYLDTEDIYEYVNIVTEYTVKTKKEKKLNELFITNINNDERNKIIDELMKSCLFESRKRILEEIKIASNNGNYFLCNTTIISIFEGIICDKIISVNQNNIKDYIKKKSTRNPYFEYTLYKVIKDRLYESFDPGKDILPPCDISRHAIMHGFDTKYGTEVVFLKLLLILYSTNTLLLESMDLGGFPRHEWGK